MTSTIEVLRYLGLAAFGGLTVVCLREWRVHSSRSIQWATVAFGSLTALGIIGLVLEQPSTRGIAGWLIKGLLTILILFPYFLYRFAAGFQRPPRTIAFIAELSTVGVVVFTFALPYLPLPGTPEPVWWTWYRIAVIVQWTLLFSIVAIRLWRAAARETTVPRRRMRTLGLAAVGLNLAILLSGVASSPPSETVRLTTQLLSLGSAALFFLGLAPPGWMLYLWRRRDAIAFQNVMGDLVRAESQEEVSALLLPHAVRMIGARGTALVSPSGEVLASHGATLGEDEIRAALAHGSPATDPSIHEVKIQAGTMFVWTSPYAPFFGREELAMLDAWGTFADMTMERCAFADRQRTFIANAAHELRTPLTTILGAASTLAKRSSQLSSEQIGDLTEALDRQADRAVRLINNLLDLAQLDSGRLTTFIEPVSLSAAAKRALLLAPPPKGTSVTVEVDPRLRASADPERLEQILVNLLVNAYRYGRSDVRIQTRDEQDAVVLAVTDGGPGVHQDVLPYLFEPFVRASGSHPGSGLGLAISRRLAEAFGGMMWYSPGTPSGACFNVRLPRPA